MKGDSDYVVSIGPSWANVRGWHRTWPGQPFVGVRVDREEVWVACEPLIAGQPISTDAREELERLFDQAGRDAWIDEQVFLFRATNLGEALRVARRAVFILGATGCDGSGPERQNTSVRDARAVLRAGCRTRD